MIQNVSRRELILVLMVSLTVALVSARPYAGSWNDGSRLALVESLVDFRTLSIDRSIFVDPARAREPRPNLMTHSNGLSWKAARSIRS